MSRMLFFGMLLFSTTLITGCANYFLRKTCESVNWYQHGFDLAMKGQRISNDDLVLNCRKAEAEMSESQLDTGFKAGMSQYCKPEVVFQTGKKGENFNLDLCDPGQGKILMGRHREGVREFCDKENGYAVGASGRTYNKICPADQEKAFLKEFSRGRKKYLQAMISESSARSQDLERKSYEADREVRTLQHQIALIPQPLTIVNRNTGPTGVTTTSTATEDPYAERRRSLEWDLSRKNQEAQALRKEQSEVRDKMHEYQRELATLD